MTDAVTAGKSRRAAIRQHKSRLKLQAQAGKYIRTLVTPEGAALQLRLANAGERAGAFLLDFALQVALMIAVIMGIGFIAGAFGYSGWQLAGALAMVLIFFIRNFYFIYFELGRKAATPGKRVTGLRVAARNGGRLKANAIIARNFMRELEVFLPLSVLFSFASNSVDGWINLALLLWCGIFVLFPLFNRDKLRVGDLIAGTIVIHAPKVQLLDDIASATPSAQTDSGYAFTPKQLDVYGIHELHVLENVLRQSNREVKRDVANRIAEKIGWSPAPGQTDTAFLENYYAAIRKHLEQRMLFGEKKADKYDRD